MSTSIHVTLIHAEVQSITGTTKLAAGAHQQIEELRAFL